MHGKNVEMSKCEMLQGSWVGGAFLLGGGAWLFGNLEKIGLSLASMTRSWHSVLIVIFFLEIVI